MKARSLVYDVPTVHRQWELIQMSSSIGLEDYVWIALTLYTQVFQLRKFPARENCPIFPSAPLPFPVFFFTSGSGLPNLSRKGQTRKPDE